MVLAGGLPDRYLKELSAWIGINIDLLLKHWNKELTTLELFMAIKKL